MPDEWSCQRLARGENAIGDFERVRQIAITRSGDGPVASRALNTLTTRFHPLERCLPPPSTEPTARPRNPPSSCLDSTLSKRSTYHARWRSYYSLVRSDRRRPDQRANPGFTKVITVLVRRKSKSTRNTVLFVGVSDAGKTAILSSVSHRFTIRSVGGCRAQTSPESCCTAGISSKTTHACLATDKLEFNSTTKCETAHPSPGHPWAPTHQGPIQRPLQ